MSMWTEEATKLELHLANSRIKELEAKIENLEARGIHTCSDLCGRPLCVASRRIKKLEATTVPLSDVVPLIDALQYYTHQPYSAAARATDEFLTKHPEAKPQ